jgi:hypothetical protein
MAAHHGTIRATDAPSGFCRFEIAFPTPEPAAGTVALSPGGTRRHGSQASGRP